MKPRCGVLSVYLTPVPLAEADDLVHNDHTAADLEADDLEANDLEADDLEADDLGVPVELEAPAAREQDAAEGRSLFERMRAELLKDIFFTYRILVRGRGGRPPELQRAIATAPAVGPA